MSLPFNLPAPSNLVYFQSDNHNRNLLGCYGHSIVQTPHLDRIAARGARFSNAYAASALCCPARASIATGQYPHQSHLWDNAIVYDGSLPSWMHRLADRGWDVVSIGKLHYRAAEDNNGFTDEIIPMHILNQKGGVAMLLRGAGEEQVHIGQWELYLDRSGTGTSYYQDFDRKVTQQAIRWLTENGKRQGKPWVLHVSYPSSHPPFSVPERLFDLYPVEEMPLPPAFAPGDRPEHPAIQYLRKLMDTKELTPDDLQRIAAGYYGLITHLDEQVGEVMTTLDTLELTEDTRVLYTTDHGEMHGSHGLLGKCNLYEGAIAVPLLMAGPGIPEGMVVDGITSHVDLFPTLVESSGVAIDAVDAPLPGKSLWPALDGATEQRVGFAEYHAAMSLNGSFMLREGDLKLIYHVDMPCQLFDLANDPDEVDDLAGRVEMVGTVARLETQLRTICNPETVDQQAKADQFAKMEYWGGKAAVLAEGQLVITPPPGIDVENAWR